MTIDPSRSTFPGPNDAEARTEESILVKFLSRSRASMTPDETFEVLLMSLALKARRRTN